jgi:hypothetical protein
MIYVVYGMSLCGVMMMMMMMMMMISISLFGPVGCGRPLRGHDIRSIRYVFAGGERVRECEREREREREREKERERKKMIRVSKTDE